MNEFLSVTEAAKLLGISRQRALVLITQGTIPATRIGRSWAIRSESVQQVTNTRNTKRGRPKRPE